MTHEISLKQAGIGVIESVVAEIMIDCLQTGMFHFVMMDAMMYRVDIDLFAPVAQSVAEMGMDGSETDKVSVVIEMAMEGSEIDKDFVVTNMYHGD